MLQQHRHITKWRSAILDYGEKLYSNAQPNRGHSAIQQNHQEPVVSHTNNNTTYFYKFYNSRSIKLDAVIEQDAEDKEKPKLKTKRQFIFTGSSCVIQLQNYSSQRGRPNFFSQFIENIKQEMAKNSEMKENLRKFREEAEKLEQSEALKKARAKYMTVEGEASALKAKLGKVKSTVTGVLEEASKSDIARKAGKISEELGKSARDAAESLSAKSQKLGSSETFKTISEATAAVREELEQTGSHARVYVAPTKLRKRQEVPEGGTKVFAPDETTMDVELHKDSRFYESWQNFKNNNAYFNKILDWKMKYEESENPMIRLSRMFTDKVSYIVGGMLQKTELSETLTEIVSLDPNFSKAKFLRQCEADIIPNILEAIIRGDLDILKDWCHEGPFNVLSAPIKAMKARGGIFDSKILDIENLDLVGGKIMEQGPVLLISFISQQILCVRDSTGAVIDGDPNKVYRVNYLWALSRDKTELDPKAAWRLLDISANSSQQLL